MKRALRFFLVGYFLLSLVGGILLCEGTLHPMRRALAPIGEDYVRQSADARNATIENVSLRSADNLTLRAWLIQPVKPNTSAVILLHGVADNRLGMLSYAQLLISQGYTVLVPDSRGHGLSEGTLTTYGLLERDDVHRWANFLRDTQHPTCLYGLGESMGAAQILQALSADDGFCAVIAESPFSNMHEIAYDRIAQQFHTGPWLGRAIFRPLIEIAFLWGRLKYRLDLAKVSPEDSVAASRTPVLLIHGSVDSNVPLRHSERILSLALSHGRSPDSIHLWPVERADHTAAYSTSPAEFEQRVLYWLETHAPLQHHAAIDQKTFSVPVAKRVCHSEKRSDAQSPPHHGPCGGGACPERSRRVSDPPRRCAAPHLHPQPGLPSP